jgi:hypothetical protein
MQLQTAPAAPALVPVPTPTRSPAAPGDVEEMIRRFAQGDYAGVMALAPPERGPGEPATA